MFDTPIVIPDSANTLELSKLYIYKVLQEMGHSLEPEFNSENPSNDELEPEGEEGFAE